MLAEASARDRYVVEIAKQSSRLNFDVIAYVVMLDHVHLIVVPSDGRISAVLRAVKQGFGREMLADMREREAPLLNRLVGPHGKQLFWQRGGGYDRNLRTESDLREKINYIHENPVRKGLAERSTDWKWSSARDFAGHSGVVHVRKKW